jgi:hypothetical protein
MALNNDQLKQNIYDFLKVRKYKPTSKDSDNKDTSVPQDADLIEFTFEKDGKPFDKAWITIEGRNDLTLYYDDDIFTGDDGEDASKEWYQFIKELKRETIDQGIQGFRLRNKDHLNDDLKQREYHTMKEKISEGYHSMGKKASYNDAVPSIKIVLQHSRAIEEGEQRYRHVERIFLENIQGERILAPTNKPGLARVYARHLAEGGVPNDERWNHIKSVCEDYTKMAGFVRATRKGQFTESAQKLVNEGLNHYQKLRESLSKMTGHRGYNTYFESWTPALMETEGDMSSLNELFVQEKLDPRIESVLPILSRLNKNLSEAALVNELSQWADDVINEEDNKPTNKKDHRAEEFKKERLKGCRCKYKNGDNKNCHIHSMRMEEVEQIDELSRDTLRSYLRKNDTRVHRDAIDMSNRDKFRPIAKNKLDIKNREDREARKQDKNNAKKELGLAKKDMGEGVFTGLGKMMMKHRLKKGITQDERSEDDAIDTMQGYDFHDEERLDHEDDFVKAYKARQRKEKALARLSKFDEATDLKTIPEAEWDYNPFKDGSASDYPSPEEDNAALKNAVIKMWKNGKDIFEIAQELECDDVDVKDIVDAYENDGELDSYENDDSDYAKDHPDHPDYFNEDLARLKKLLGN